MRLFAHHNREQDSCRREPGYRHRTFVSPSFSFLHQVSNLPTPQPQNTQSYDALDLTENSLTTLANFPLLPRLQTLLLARNRISSISPSLAKSLPNLTTLNLSSNNIAELADIDPLARQTHLTHLTLSGNPLTNRPHYRAWVVWRVPSLRFLDYRKVRDVERREAARLFGTISTSDAEDGEGSGLTALAHKIAGTKSKTFDAGAGAGAGAGVVDAVNGASGGGSLDGIGRMQFTDEEKGRIRAALTNAKSDAELERLRKIIASGQVPDVDMGGT